MGTRKVADVYAELQQYRTATDARLDSIYQALVSIMEEDRQSREAAERRHTEIMAMLMNQSKLKQPVVSQSGPPLSQSTSDAVPPLGVSTSRVMGVEDVEDIEGTKSDGQEISKEAGKETKVIVGPTVAEDCCEDPSYRGEVRGCHLINQNKDESVVQSANRMFMGLDRPGSSFSTIKLKRVDQE